MKPLQNYHFGVNLWGLLLFLLLMLPNFIWFSFPAPHDILRKESLTPIVDAVGSVFQVLTIACLCFVSNNERKKLRFSPLVVLTIVCVLTYYIGWILYYSGITGMCVILLLTVVPCVSFILFATNRNNIPAVLSAIGFTVCHVIFGVVNFV